MVRGNGNLIAPSFVILVFMLSFVCGLSLVRGEVTVGVDKAFNGREIKVRSGDMIRVELDQLGSAGYTWEIQGLDDRHFEVVSTKTPEANAEAWSCRCASKENMAYPDERKGEIGTQIYPLQAMGGERETSGYVCA